MTVTERAIVLLGHGARDAEWAGTLERLQQRIAARDASLRVAVAFLGHLAPSLPDCIDHLVHEGGRDIRVVPVFIARGGHLKHDIPASVQVIAERHPQARITLLPAIGEVDSVIDAMAGWIVTSA